MARAWWGSGGGASHIKMTGVLVVPFQGQQAVLVPLGMFNLKRATARTFVVPFRVLSQKMTEDNVLSSFRIGTPKTGGILVCLRGSF